MLRLGIVLLCLFCVSANAGVVAGDTNVSVVDLGNGSYDYTFVFDQGSGRTVGDGNGMVFSGLGLDLYVTAMTDSIYQCCNITTDSVVQTADGLGAISALSTNDGFERLADGNAEGLFFSLGDSSYANNQPFELMDIGLNGLGRDDAFGGFGINYDITGAGHPVYGALYANRSSWVASDWDGVSGDSASRGNLGYGSNFMVTTSVSMAATNNVCQSNPGDERCVHTTDSFIESITIRLTTPPVQSVPAPAGFLLFLVGLTGLIALRRS